MAVKHKGRTKKKQSALKESGEKSPFWALAGATLLCLLALFFLLGGFGTGGPLPVDLFHGAYTVLGWTAYLVPLALVYWGVVKLKSEDHRITPSKFGGMARSEERRV